MFSLSSLEIFIFYAKAEITNVCITSIELYNHKSDK